MSEDKTYDGEVEEHREVEADSQSEPKEESTALLKVDESTAPSDEEIEEDDQLPPVPALQRMRNARRYGASALGVGFITRAVVTLCTTVEDTASIADLLLTYTRFYLILILVLLAFFGVGATAVTWGFWTPPVQEYSAIAIDWVRRRCGGDAIVPVERRSTQGCQERAMTSVGWLGYVSLSCSVATLGLVANENEEGTRMMLSRANPTNFTVIFSLILGLIATVYSAVTDLHSLWQYRFAAQQNNEVRRRPSAAIYIISVLGTFELFYRTWILIYLTFLERWDSRVAGFVVSTLFTLLGTYVNFCFQTSYALEGSAFLMRVKLAMVNLPPPVKIVFLGLIGLTTVVSNMCMSTFNMVTLLPSIFNERLGYSIGQSVFNVVGVATAAGVTLGDLLSSYMEVIRQMNGWDQPDNLFLRGVRSDPVRLGRSHWSGSHRGPFSHNADRVEVLPENYQEPSETVPDKDAIPLVSADHEAQASASGAYERHDFTDFN